MADPARKGKTMLAGLVITPPVLGRISIGKVVERNGKRLPEKEDQFRLTSLMQGPNGWIPHHLDEGWRKAFGGKLRTLPVMLLFNDPSLNFRVSYCCFDRETGRPLCVGNGERCKRFTGEGIESLPCPAPEGCGLAKGGRCKPYGRLNVVLEDLDPLGSFLFRTTGFNSIRTLTARLAYFQAISGNRLACLPLALRLRGKSTRMSHGSPIYFVDLTLRDAMGLPETLQAAEAIAQDRSRMGYQQEALDEAARQGLAQGAFEDTEEEGEMVREEFYGEEGGEEKPEAAPGPTKSQPTLGEKLGAKVKGKD